MPKKFKYHFKKFPPILREMVMEAMSEDMKNSRFIPYRLNPLMVAFDWSDNPSFSDSGFWSAVTQDALHHGVWNDKP